MSWEFRFGCFDQMRNFSSALEQTIEEVCEFVEMGGIDPGSWDLVEGFVEDRFREGLDA